MSDDVQRLYSRAFESLERGDDRGAEEDLAQVVALTGSWEALLTLAFARQRLREHERASTAVTTAIEQACAVAAWVKPATASGVVDRLCSALQPLLPTLDATAVEAA
eukprot:3862016-Prymnesium_polylepis.1